MRAAALLAWVRLNVYSGRRRQVFAKASGSSTFTKDALLDNLEATLGKKWVNHICKDLQAIVIAEVAGCYDPKQKVVFIDSRQSESDATQQLIMELSNHQNRDTFSDIKASAKSMSRDKFIERAEMLEHVGVENVIKSYDQAVRLKLKWVKSSCVYGKMRGMSFEEYYKNVSEEHRERWGKMYDDLLKGDK